MESIDDRGMRLLVNTQTPLIRFREEDFGGAMDEPVQLSGLREPDDFKFTTGGVTRMILPLLKRWLASGTASTAEWVALSGGERAPLAELDDIRLSFVGLPPGETRGYAAVKEQIWALLNSNPTNGAAPGRTKELSDPHWAAFEMYQRRSADALEQAADRMGGADLLYVHDFQQVGVASAWQGPRIPRVFHLHTPYPSVMPRAWASRLVGRMRAYDAVVTSTNRYADNLRADGLDVPIHVIRPFIDPMDHRPSTSADVHTFRDKFHIAPTERIILNVGRMDPMKGQDRLIQALPRILASVPDARLVLVGNGSFSSSKTGGLGLSKGAQWRAALEALARDLRVADRVTFTGHLDDELLPAAYAACEAFALPSTREGFGLAVIEAWRHQKPVAVSQRAGVAELVVDGVNGFAPDCADPGELARAIMEILRDPDLAASMGKQGHLASEEATLPYGSLQLERLFHELLSGRAPEAVAHA